MSADACHYCGGPATLLCDAEKLVSAAIRRLDTTTLEDITCSRKLCRHHAVLISNVHYCGEDGCETDTHDLCLDCYAIKEGRPVNFTRKFLYFPAARAGLGV